MWLSLADLSSLQCRRLHGPTDEIKATQPVEAPRASTATQPVEAPGVTTVMKHTGQDIRAQIAADDQRFSPWIQFARPSPVPVLNKS